MLEISVNTFLSMEEVAKYYELCEYETLKEMADKLGFKKHQIGPLVRSSYKAVDLC